VTRDRWSRQRAANRTSSGGFWKPKDGENLIRIFPFKHKVADYDVALKRYPPEPIEADDPKVGDIIEEFFTVSRRHFRTLEGKSAQCNSVRAYDGSFHGECSSCEHSRRLYKGTEDDKKAARNYRAQTKFVLAVCNVEADNKTFQIWDAPSTIIDFILESMGKKKYKDEEILGYEGRDLSFVYNSKSTSPKGWYTAIEWMDRGQEVELSATELGSPPDLLARNQYVPTVYHSMFPLEEEKGKVEEEKEPDPPKAEEPKKPSRKKKKAAPAPEPEPAPADLTKGQVVYYMEDDERVKAVVTNPQKDEDGFFRIEGPDGEEYEIKEEELVA